MRWILAVLLMAAPLVVSASTTNTCVNCGGKKTGEWKKDRGCTTGTTYTTTAAIAKAKTAPQAVYQSCRMGRKLTYDFPEIANGLHQVRLHFAELQAGEIGERVFKLKIEGVTAVSNLDVFARAKGKNRALRLTFNVRVMDGNGLQIQGIGLHGAEAFFSGIEIGPSMVLIPTGASHVTDPDFGSYWVGASGLFMDRTEVAKAQWDEVRAWAVSNGYSDLSAGIAKGAAHPVVGVTWYDCVKWCNARSQKEGLAPVYYDSPARTNLYQTGNISVGDFCVRWTGGYRLPTRMEWEYAARGGSTGTRFPWGDTISQSQANYFSDGSQIYDLGPTNGYHAAFSTNGFPYTAPVGSFAPRGYGAGVFDMVGNVREWTWTWGAVPPVYMTWNPVLGGSSWGDPAAYCRVGLTGMFDPGVPDLRFGFRSVRNVPGTPVDVALTPAGVSENQPFGTVVGILSVVDPPAGKTYTYMLVSGEGSGNNDRFTINGASLKTAAVFDYEAVKSYFIRVFAKDQDGLYVQMPLTVSVENVNEVPTDVLLSSTNVLENQPVGTTVGALSTTDPDLGDTFTYELVSGAGDADNGSFTNVGSFLRTTASFDYETRKNYSIRVRAMDQGGLSVEKAFTIGIQNVDEPPTNIIVNTPYVQENQPTGTVVSSLFTQDPDDFSGFAYSLVAGAGDTDNAAFAFVGNRFQTAGVFDFEAKSSHSVRIQSSSTHDWQHYAKAFTITIQDVNEAPTNITLSNSSVLEYQPAGTEVGVLTSGDPDAGDTFTYTLVAGEGGTDNKSFIIKDDQLQTAAEFSAKDKDTYLIRIRTSDSGGLWCEAPFTIHVLIGR